MQKYRKLCTCLLYVARQVWVWWVSQYSLHRAEWMPAASPHETSLATVGQIAAWGGSEIARCERWLTTAQREWWHASGVRIGSHLSHRSCFERDPLLGFCGRGVGLLHCNFGAGFEIFGSHRLVGVEEALLCIFWHH